MNEHVVIPQAAEAELELVSMLLSQDGARVLAATELRAEAFYNPHCREVWAAGEAVWRRGGNVDQGTVADELDRLGRLQAIGGYTGLAELGERVGQRDTAPYMAERVRRAFSKRRLALALSDLQRRALAPDEEPSAVLAQATGLLSEAVEDRADRTRSLAAVAKDVLGAKEREVQDLKAGRTVTRFRTGWEEVDAILGGLVDCSLNVLAGGTSHGKSTVARGVMMALAETGIPSHLFSLEDPDVTVAERALADYGDVNLHQLANAPESLDVRSWGRLQEAQLRMSLADRVLVDESSGRSIGEIAMRVRKHRPRWGTRLVVIDYLQKLRDPRVRPGPGWKRDNADLALDGATRLARDEGVCVLMLSQLNREAAKEQRAPELGEMRESGDIENQARVVMAIYRPERDARDAKGKAELDGKAVLRVLKNFRGPTGDADLMFDKPSASFRSPRAMSAAVNQSRGARW